MRASRRPATLYALCVTEIVSWGVLYYAFPVLAPSIMADTGWTLTAISAVFSAALIVAALIGIPVGRVLDKRGPRWIMTTGSVLAGLATALIAWSPSLLAFTLGWLMAGIAMAGVLYQPAFAALTRWYAPRHLPALTTVTLVAGLASTVFAPLTAALEARTDWRSTYLLLGTALLVVTVPVHALALRRPWPPEPDHDRAVGVRDYAASIARSPSFLFLAAGLTLASLAAYATMISLVPLFVERGLSVELAAWALGLGGVGQVAGRLAYGSLARRLGLRSRTTAVFGLAALTTGALTLASAPAVLIAIAILAGFSRGIGTLLQATAIIDRWGPRAYGRLSAILGAPVIAATALAPWAGASLAAALGGYTTAFATLAALGLLGAILLAASVPRRVGSAPKVNTR